MLVFPYTSSRAPEGLLTTAVPARPGYDASQLGVNLLRERNEMSTVLRKTVFAVEKSARTESGRRDRLWDVRMASRTIRNLI